MNKTATHAELARRAALLREIVDQASKMEDDPVMAHSLSEVSSVCKWCEKQFG